MKKLVFGAACLTLVLGFAASLQAAECGAQGLSTPAMSTDGSAQETESLLAHPAALLDESLASPIAAEDTGAGAAVCAYILCIQTPDGGCGCEGFYCKGHFICGEPIQ